jgi:phosphonate transport system ATP-binding protein
LQTHCETQHGIHELDAPHLHVEGLTVERGGRVLVRELNLAVPRGRFVAVIGPSGAGKSTLLETLAGMRPHDPGSITYRCQQHCLHAPIDFRSRIGLVFQQLHLARNASALQNVLAGALSRHPWWRTLAGFPASERMRAHHCLNALGLGQHGNCLVRRLSGGEQQRVAVARALVQEPELILADEPVSHLDTSLAKRVLAMLKEETRRSARTVLCVLHDLSLVEHFADAVLSLSAEKRGGWQWQPSHS